MMNKNDVINAINNFLPQYEYEYGKPYEVGSGVYNIVDEWYRNKANTPIFRAMEKHPAYNGRFQIVLNADFHRRIDSDEVSSFTDWMKEMLDFHEDEHVIYGDTETEMDEAVVTYTTPRAIHMIIKSPYGVWYNLRTTFDFTVLREDCFAVDGRRIITEQQTNALNSFCVSPMQYFDDDMLNIFNDAFPWLKAHNGAKASKVFRRICKEFGLDQLDEFKARWPRFADSINPLNVTKWTIISWNPIDYLTMSFGSDWQSCHTIDKTGRRGVGGDHYHGCYSSGTLSYMMDPSSIVVYTVDRSYEGNEFEYQPKTSRQMFHISDDIIVQGRLYPQANDVGSKDIYDTMRDIVQRVYSESMHVPNSWKKTSGIDECCDVILTDDCATNYRDYESFGTCTVSKRNEWGGQLIQVGHAPICPLCGCEHDRSDNIMCEDCATTIVCEHCGERINMDDCVRTADGNYYCDSCCASEDGYVYCYNDDEWHFRDDDDVIYDNYMDEYYYISWCDDYIVTEDGNTYFCSEHAEMDGYTCLDNGKWVDSDEAVTCPVCGAVVSYDDYDDELDMCDDCAEAKKEERGVS